MPTELDADVIIVGAGILGALAAERIALKGKSVLILEAGPRVQRSMLVNAFRNSPDKSDIYSIYPELPWAPKSSGGKYSNQYIENVGPHRWLPGMLKVVGGTTMNWAGAFWRFLPNDFKLKTLYGWGRDWPITYDDLEPWYTLAEQITGCSGNDSEDKSGRGGAAYPPRSAPYPLPQEKWSTYTSAVADKMNTIGFTMLDEPHLRATRSFDGRPPCLGQNNCEPICPISALYSGDMAVARAERGGAKVLPETVVYRLEKGPGGKLAAVHTKSPDGVSTRRTARYFVLAAHAVEIPKLMLVSEVGNSSDQVGRNLMSHPSHFYECLAKDALWPGRGPIQQGSVNDRCDGPHRAKHAAIRYGSNNRSAHLRFTDQLLKEGIIGRELDERIRHDTSRYVSITTGMEMLPNPANRITLSDRKDSLGLPTPRIYFDVDEYCGNASIVAHEDFKQFDKAFEIQTRLGDRDAWRFAAHIMGSTIMGADPRTSVVDADCRSHDHSNLFIASTGVMPSSATWNPTLTGCALALRLAEVVAREA